MEGRREEENEELERPCEGVSLLDEPCDLAATIHCEMCGRWFCAGHAEDEVWHPCMLETGEEGGEA
jgi:hypothetical protein